MDNYTKSEHQIRDVETNRELYIGGSDLPYVLRLNKCYGTSLIQFAKEKLKIVPTQFKGNEHTRYGQLMEPLVRDYINAMFNTNFKEDSIIDQTRMYRGNCDGIDKEKKILLEIKTCGVKLDVKMYEPQCQFYMDLFNIDECWLVGYHKPDNFYTGVDFNLENDACYFDLDFNEKNIEIRKLTRNTQMFEKIEREIEKFKYLLECLREEEILNGQTATKLTTSRNYL